MPAADSAQVLRRLLVKVGAGGPALKRDALLELDEAVERVGQARLQQRQRFLAVRFGPRKHAAHKKVHDCGREQALSRRAKRGRHRHRNASAYLRKQLVARNVEHAVAREHLDGADAGNNRLGNCRGIVVDEPEIVLASQLRQAHRASAPSHALRKRVQAVQLLGLKSGDNAAAALEQPFAQRGFRRRVFRRSRHFCASAKTLHGALEAVAQPREIKARLAASRKTLFAHQALHQRNPTLHIHTERSVYPLVNEAFRVRRAPVAFALSCARADSRAEIYARSP